MIRKTIFKDEIRFVFLGHKDELSESEEHQIIHSIFENPLTISKQYMLRKEINTLEDLRVVLNEIIKDKKRLLGQLTHYS